MALRWLWIVLLAFQPQPAWPASHDALARKVGQMIMVGFHGNEAADPRFKDILRQLEAGLIGGVLFLDYNLTRPAEIRKMTAAIRNCRCCARPLIGLDEEGGKVQRLSLRSSPDHTPGAAVVAARNSDRLAGKTYAALARKVAAAGFNLNFAPVVDVNINPRNPMIGRLGRSFSADSGIVSRFARIFVRRHRDTGVLTALKHFPWHGSAAGDTHLGYVDVTQTWQREIELQRYQALIKEGLADMVMVGHISSNGWNGLASLSPSDAISVILRAELGYQGVVITDDLEMGEVRHNNPDFSKAIIRAVKAGNDIILLSNRVLNRERAGDWINATIVVAVQDGHYPQSYIDESLRRVEALKAKLK